MSNKIILKKYTSTFGSLLLGSFNNKLCMLDWEFRKMRNAIDKRIQVGLKATFQKGNSDVLESTISQLELYAKGELTDFDIPLLFVGTEFQKKVWNQLLQIRYGKTESYLNLAKKMDNVKAIRAVASANGANAISIIVPCHRIIGTNGSLVGYAGGLQTKKKLLELENPLRKSQLKLF